MEINYELICKILNRANEKIHPALQAYIRNSDDSILIDGNLRKNEINEAIKEIYNG